MRAFDTDVVEAVWGAVLARLPAHPYPARSHPLGCHRRRVHNPRCFDGEATGPNPTDRGKQRWKWSIACDRWAIPLGAATGGANRHDLTLLEPTLTAVADRALLDDIATLHLDRGYDNDTARNICAPLGLRDTVIAAKRRSRSQRHTEPRHSGLGLRWAVERTNSWLSNLGQLRRTTDRYLRHRHAHLSLAITLIITVKLIDWAHRWNPPG